MISIARCAAILGIACAFVPSPAPACSVCQPGDPLFTPEGASAQRSGDVTLYLETRQSSKRSGALPHEHVHDPNEEEEEHAGRDEEENTTSEAVLYASWTPLERLTLAASLPLRWISIEEEPAGEPSSSLHNSGFGDTSLFATAVLWRDRNELPSTWLEARLMLKAPTGRDDERIDGVLDPHAQLGTGSRDWGGGLAATRRLESATLYGSTFYRFNSEGALDYEYGDVLLANAAVQSDSLWLAAPHAPLSTGLELNFRYAGKDTFEGQSYDDSGGSIFYATPFVELGFGAAGRERPAGLRLSVRLPLGNGGLNGYQKEGVVYGAALRFGF